MKVIKDYFRIFVLFSFLFGVGVASCTKKSEGNPRELPSELYSKSLDIIGHSIKKIRNARNMQELDSLFDIYENEISELNMEYPAKADLSLTESENDLLSFRIMELLNSRDSVKNILRSSQACDSILLDSVSDHKLSYHSSGN